MPRKPKVRRTPKRSGRSVGRTEERQRGRDVPQVRDRSHALLRWRDEVEEGARAARGGRSAAARPDVEQEKRIKQLERAMGRSHLQIEILKNVLGECAAGRPIRRHGNWWPTVRK